MSKLTLLLLKEKRYEDLEKALQDSNYRKKLMEEYRMQIASMREKDERLTT